MEGTFFPLYPAPATPFPEQLPADLRALPLVNADGLFTSDFLGSEVSRDSHFAESILAFGRCNGVTGESETEAKRTTEAALGNTPGSFR